MEIFAYFGRESGFHFRKLVPLGQMESANMEFQNHEGSCFEAKIESITMTSLLQYKLYIFTLERIFLIQIFTICTLKYSNTERKLLFRSFTPKVHFQIFLWIGCNMKSTVPEFYTECISPDFHS